MDGVSGSDAAKTTIGEGKTPPLTEDLKKVVQGGVQVSLPAVAKLNPSAIDFIPKFGNLSMNSTTQTTSTTTSRPVYSKYSTPTNPDSTSTLNPTSNEFVPSHNFPLPKDPKELVPSMFGSAELSRIPNGGAGDYGNGMGFDDEDVDGYLSANDIMRGYEKAAPTDMRDSSDGSVLKSAAEMLWKVFYYPGSFEDMARKFENTLKMTDPSENTMTNLAEMLIHWVSEWSWGDLWQVLHWVCYCVGNQFTRAAVWGM